MGGAEITHGGDGGGHGGAWMGAAEGVSSGQTVGVLKAETTPQDLQDRTWDQRRENREPWKRQGRRRRSAVQGQVCVEMDVWVLRTVSFSWAILPTGDSRPCMGTCVVITLGVLLALQGWCQGCCSTPAVPGVPTPQK